MIYSAAEQGAVYTTWWIPVSPHILVPKSWVLIPELGSACRTIPPGAFFKRLLMGERANGGTRGRRSALFLFLKEGVEPSVQTRGEKGPESIWGHRGSTRKLKHQRLRHLVPKASGWMAAASLKSRRTRAQDWAWLGWERLKTALSKPAKPVSGGQASGSERPSAPGVLGRGPPATPRAPFSWSTGWTHL